MTSLLEQRLSDARRNHDNEIRRMGIEVELAGLEPSVLSAELCRTFGGQSEWQSPFEIIVENTEFGTFKLELDSQQIKEIGQQSSIPGDPSEEPQGFERSYIELVSDLAVNLVPWEIVTPPIPLESLPKLYSLVSSLQGAGAKGTREAMHYAFGVHLNPELTSLDADNILRHLQSFCCLYDWIRHVERTDLARRITPYINHFGSDYLGLILDDDYQPSIDTLIDDYLEHNPTRNRSLDMLPLFKFLDEDRVLARIEDQRVNARPTFHYRLPNCDIGNPDWNLDLSIEMWMAVEALANHDSLADLRQQLKTDVDKLLPVSSKQWISVCEAHLREQELFPAIVDQWEQA